MMSITPNPSRKKIEQEEMLLVEKCQKQEKLKKVMAKMFTIKIEIPKTTKQVI